VYLWSPWRCSALEHRLFEGVKAIPGVQFESEADELRLHLTEAKLWPMLLNVTARVLKGWQEEAADAGTERRAWRWLLEADTDDHGYDHTGDRTCIWVFLRLSLERGSPTDGEKGEDIDLNGFGVRIWSTEE
jgi:hypothetical protein